MVQITHLKKSLKEYMGEWGVAPHSVRITFPFLLSETKKAEEAIEREYEAMKKFIQDAYKVIINKVLKECIIP